MLKSSIFNSSSRSDISKLPSSSRSIFKSSKLSSSSSSDSKFSLGSSKFNSSGSSSSSGSESSIDSIGLSWITSSDKSISSTSLPNVEKSSTKSVGKNGFLIVRVKVSSSSALREQI